MSQIAINQEMAVGYAGMWADAAENTVESKVNAEASLPIAFGWAVRQGTGDRECLKVIADTNKIIGVVAHSHVYAKGGSLPQLDTVGVLPKNVLNVVRRGRLYVVVGEAVLAGQRPYYQISTQRWRISSVMGDTIDASLQAQFRTSQSTVGGIAVLEFDFLMSPT